VGWGGAPAYSGQGKKGIKEEDSLMYVDLP